MLTAQRIREASHHPRVRLTLAVLILLMGLAWIAHPTGASRLLFYDALTARGQQLVDTSLKENFLAFAAVSAVKATLALIEGSSVGVGFDLEVGDLAQPAYDYVDFVWRIFLFANVILLTYKILLESGICTIGIQLAGVGLMLLGLLMLYPRHGQAMARWVRRCLAVGVLAAYVVPLSLIASNLLASHYTAPLKARQFERMDSVRQEFVQAKQRVTDLRDAIKITRPGESLKELRERLMYLIHSASRLARDGLNAFLHYILIVLFDLLVLPLLTALALYYCATLALRPHSPAPPTRSPDDEASESPPHHVAS